jgi:hypothetical protein
MIYRAQQAQAGATPPPGGGAGQAGGPKQPSGSPDEPVDADFEVKH